MWCEKETFIKYEAFNIIGEINISRIEVTGKLGRDTGEKWGSCGRVEQRGMGAKRGSREGK